MPITFTINDVPVSAEKGERVFSVARREGFNIPSLCSHETVEPNASCRLCLVEVISPRGPSITTSCDLRVNEGLRVITDSPEIRKQRAINLELLLARAPHSVRIRALAEEYGVHRTRYSEPEKTALQDCILCELCVRVCEKLGHGALSSIGRGDGKQVGAPFGEPSEKCVACGACVSVCPTSCIPVVDTKTTRTIWGRTFEFILCRECGAPVITEEHKKHSMARCGLPEDYYNVCESCKRSNTAKRFSTVVL